jgi:hypothetical protein
MNRLKALEESLNQLNGRRRERTITMDDIRQAVSEARRGGYGWVSGGTVPNSYKYRAISSSCMAVKTGGSIYVALGTHDAHGSQTTWFGTENRSPNFARWAYQMTTHPLCYSAHCLLSRWTRLSRADVAALMRKA